MNHLKGHLTIALTLLFSYLTVGESQATLEQAKLYQKVFGGDKPKCIQCHAVKLPKKEDGKHDPNDYGKKLLAVQEKPDEETYKKVGPAPTPSET